MVEATVRAGFISPEEIYERSDVGSLDRRLRLGFSFPMDNVSQLGGRLDDTRRKKTRVIMDSPAGRKPGRSGNCSASCSRGEPVVVDAVSPGLGVSTGNCRKPYFSRAAVPERQVPLG